MMEYNKEVTIIIAAHKAYRMPEDDIYLPVHVGAYGKEEAEWNRHFAKDNMGEHISALNPSFCELTGLYWAWKNLNADFIGLVHYRRYFSMRKAEDPFQGILTGEQLLPLLAQYDVFVPRKRKYYIESLYSHYAHTHYAIQLDAAREVLEQKYPAYLPAYDRVLKQTYGYMFNMMILKRPLLDDYCDWLFSVLFALKERFGAKSLAEGENSVVPQDQNLPVLSDFQARFYGRVSEILFNVWLARKAEEGIIDPARIKELDFLNLEGENWKKKGISFLQAKFTGKKYEKSF